MTRRIDLKEILTALLWLVIMFFLWDAGHSHRWIHTFLSAFGALMIGLLPLWIVIECGGRDVLELPAPDPKNSDGD